MTTEMFEAMYRHAVRKAHGFIPPQEVEDAAQTAMLAVVRASRRLDLDRDPWPLLSLVVRQELGMYARRLYNSPETAAGDDLTAFERPGVREDPPLSARVAAALDGLTETQRRVALCFAADGRTKQQAASLLGVSDVAVGTAWRRALPKLREQLAS